MLSMKDFGRGFRDYCQITSIHGLQYLGDQNRPWKEKFFWMSIITVFVYFCSSLTHNVWLKWTETPVIVSFSEKSTPVWEIPFPALTICAETKSRPFAMNFTRFYNLMLDNLEVDRPPLDGVNVTAGELRRMQTMMQICGNHLSEELGFPELQPADYYGELEAMTPALNETFPFCKWQNRLGTCEQLLDAVFTDEGICYTFNGLNASEHYREDTFQHRQFKKSLRPRERNWSLQDGYSKRSGVDVYPFRVLGAGMRAGMFIALNGNASNLDYICRGPVQGFKLVLHSPDDVPLVSRQFVRIPFGKEVLVSVKPKMILTSDGVNNYNPNQRQCYFNSERYLRFFQTYTQGNCEMECLTNHTLRKCGCVKFSMPRLPSTTVCDESKILCYDLAEDEVLLAEFTEGLQLSGLNYRGLTKCNCLPSCTSLAFNTEISEAVLDMESLLRAYGEPSLADDNALMSRVLVSFKESQFITSKRSELYGLTDFLANCGGLFGLFMGVSFLSIVEIVYHCTLRCWDSVWRRDFDVV